MKSIPLPKNKETIVDDSDYVYLSLKKWMIDKTGYVIGWTKMVNGKRRWVRMHREIMKAPRGVFVDHIDHDKLNNKRDNLRLCNNQQNKMNSAINARKRKYSQYKGVTLDINNPDKWLAKISINNNKIYLGSFISEKDAAKAYNKAAKYYFKEFACLNKI